MSEEKQFKGPYWMREPIPDEYRVKYIDREDILKRLNNGEKILFRPDAWMKVAPVIYFEKDSRLKAIRRNTFNSLRNKGIIKLESQGGFVRETEIWIINNTK